MSLYGLLGVVFVVGHSHPQADHYNYQLLQPAQRHACDLFIILLREAVAWIQQRHSLAFVIVKSWRRKMVEVGCSSGTGRRWRGD